MDIGGDGSITGAHAPEAQTPDDVLKQAAALDQKDQVAEALALLETRQTLFADLPPSRPISTSTGPHESGPHEGDLPEGRSLHEAGGRHAGAAPVFSGGVLGGHGKRRRP